MPQNGIHVPLESGVGSASSSHASMLVQRVPFPPRSVPGMFPVEHQPPEDPWQVRFHVEPSRGPPHPDPKRSRCIGSNGQRFDTVHSPAAARRPDPRSLTVLNATRELSMRGDVARTTHAAADRLTVRCCVRSPTDPWTRSARPRPHRQGGMPLDLERHARIDTGPSPGPFPSGARSMSRPSETPHGRLQLGAPSLRGGSWGQTMAASSRRSDASDRRPHAHQRGSGGHDARGTPTAPWSATRPWPRVPPRSGTANREAWSGTATGREHPEPPHSSDSDAGVHGALNLDLRDRAPHASSGTLVEPAQQRSSDRCTSDPDVGVTAGREAEAHRSRRKLDPGGRSVHTPRTAGVPRSTQPRAAQVAPNTEVPSWLGPHQGTCRSARNTPPVTTPRGAGPPARTPRSPPPTGLFRRRGTSRRPTSGPRAPAPYTSV